VSVAESPRPSPQNTRSSLIFEALSELVRAREFQFVSRVQLEPPAGPGYAISTETSLDIVPAVARGEVDIAIMNPSAILTAAYLGRGPFSEAYPLRVITTIPSQDWYFFAVTEASGITSLAEIRERRYPLRVSLRADRQGIVKYYAEETLRYYGFTLQDIESWGGKVSFDPGIPAVPGRAGRVASGELDALFDEATNRFVPMLDELKMRLIQLDDGALKYLEGRGLHAAPMPRSYFPNLPSDMLAPDFSGWPLFTREDAPDDLIYHFCKALDTRKGAVLWNQPTSLPVAEMCRDTPAGPRRIPLHPAAERYWRDAGYL
jgi:TRAP-type uncharacterized transport system substrate-binding protein